MREINFNELVVDLRLYQDLKLFGLSDRSSLRDLVLEDVCDVPAPTEDHSLPLNQLVLVSKVCA